MPLRAWSATIQRKSKSMLVNLIMIVVGSIFLILAFAPSTRLRWFTSSDPRCAHQSGWTIHFRGTWTDCIGHRSSWVAFMSKIQDSLLFTLTLAVRTRLRTDKDPSLFASILVESRVDPYRCLAVPEQTTSWREARAHTRSS